jgi:hypothetical protein
MTDVLHRDGAVLSATEVLRAELSNADHLGVLGSIWYDQARRAQAARFEKALREVLTTADAEAALADPACAWLWRSLREAEAAGRDAGDILREAVAARPLHDARNVARVVDSRIRRMLAGLVPRARGSWSGRVPEMGDAELNRFMAELAAAMDDRVRRIGEHAARTAPRWATQALGDVPGDPVSRLEWERRAAALGAYRELYGYDAPGDAIGPEPGKTSPDARADWHAAFAALGEADGTGMRRYTDAQLRLQRATYEQETNWAPPYVAEELRLARLQARTAFENATREQHEARAAASPEAALRHEGLAGMWRAMQARAGALAESLAGAQETRRQWAALTEPTRRVALAADLELRRRHPDRHPPPLRTAELDIAGSGSARSRSPQAWVQRALDGAGHLPDTAPEAAGRESAAASGRGADGDQQSQPSPAEPNGHGQDVADQLTRILASARVAQAKIDELASLRVPAEDYEAADLGPAWNVLARRDREAIIQPPRPHLVPARAVLSRSQDRVAVMEAEMG